MAQVAKTSAPVAPQPTASKSRAGTGHRVASLGGSVDELSSSIGLALDGATHDNSRGDDAGLGSQNQPSGQSPQDGAFAYGRLFRADSSVFAAIFEGAANSGNNAPDGPPRISAPVSKAINIYETNAKVIAGNYTLPGMSLSIRL